MGIQSRPGNPRVRLSTVVIMKISCIFSASLVFGIVGAFDLFDPFNSSPSVSRSQRQFESVPALPEATTVVPSVTTIQATTTIPSTTIAPTAAPTTAGKTVSTTTEFRDEDYEEVDVVPVTRKPLSADDKRWIQSILSRTTKRT